MDAQQRLDAALQALVEAIQAGSEFPDEAHRMARRFGVPQDALEAAYDERCAGVDATREMGLDDDFGNEFGNA